MPPRPGARLGPYQLGSAIGAGGMGQVYRAHDSRLGRDVAIKILPTEFADDPDRLRRFESEARAAAALSHPNILSVFDVGREDDTAYLVTELLVGQTLRDAIDARRPYAGAGAGVAAAMPVSSALEYATQIAEGLAAAHACGIVHRDLKPENVFVTTDGRVKVLDFGLAKSQDLSVTAAAAATLGGSSASHATAPYVILGTPGYMAPEQVRGEPVDHRADIFAFGCVLYELLGGTRAFSGATTVDTLSATLKDTPPPLASHAAGDAIAAPLAHIVERCLEKAPAARFQSAADLAFALKQLAGVGIAARSTRSVASARPEGRPWRRVLPWVVAAASVAAGTLGWWAPAGSVDHAPAPAVRLTLPIDETLDAQWGPQFALSPDGSRLIYLAHDADPTPRIFQRRLDEDRGRPVANTEFAQGLAFSPDSRWIVYNSTGPKGPGKFKVPVDGGLPISFDFVPGQPGSGGGPHITSWGRNQMLVFAAPAARGALLGSLWRIPASGGQVSVVAEPMGTAGERAYYAPSVLPNGSILFGIDRPGSPAVAVLPQGSPPPRILIEGARQARFVEPGYLLFARRTTLLAAPFDLKSLSVTGPAVPVLDGVRALGFLTSAFSLSQSGTLVYVPGADSPPVQRVLSLIDRRTGRETTLPFTPGNYDADARFAPDGGAVAIGVSTPDGERTVRSLWLGDPVRGALTRLAPDAHSFAWTPDGRRIVFQMSDNSVAWRDRDLAAPARPLLPAAQIGNIWGEPTWGPDGALIFAMIGTQANGIDLWTARGLADATTPPGGDSIVSLLEEPGHHNVPTASPDRSWLAYRDGSNIYVRSLSGSAVRHPVAVDGHAPMRWVGGELFFVRRGKVMAAAMATSPTLAIGSPRDILTLPPGATFADVTPDGRQFLLVKRVSEPAPEPPPREFKVVINFVAELRRRVAAGQ